MKLTNPSAGTVGRLTTCALTVFLLLSGSPLRAGAEEMHPIPVVAPGPAVSAPVLPAPATQPGYPAPGYVPQPYAPGHVPPDSHRGQPFLFGPPTYRSPGLAVALSLQPLPIDLGNLYAENLGWGVAYTAVEVALLAPMMWMTGQHMDHGNGDDRRWTGMESGMMVGFISGYVVVKLMAGLHAGYAARSFNQTFEGRGMAVVVPTAGGALLTWTKTL